MKRALLLLFLATGCPTTDDDDATLPVDDDDSTTAQDDDDSSLANDDDATTPPPSDLDEDGYSVADGDCDDENPEVHPGVPTDGCDGLDSDCDGEVDEDPEPVIGLAPGQWTSDDVFALVDDPTGEWLLGEIPANRGAGGSTPTILSRASRLEDGWTQEEGLMALPMPDCAGERSVDFGTSFIAASSINFSTPASRFDLNGDGYADTRLQNRIYFGPHVGDLGPADADITLPFTPTGLDAYDIDGDGYNDLVASHYGSEIAVFWAGPIIGPSLSLDDAVGVEGPDVISAFGWTLAILPVPGGEAVTLIGSPGSPGGAVHYVLGFPEPGQTQPDGMLDLTPWYDPINGRVWGRGLATDGQSRACVGPGGAGSSGPVGCGTWDELLVGALSQVLGPYAPGEYLDMTPELVAVGNPNYSVVLEPSLTTFGRVQVSATSGDSWTIHCASNAECGGGFGLGAALLPDPARPAITWLVTNGRFNIHFFPLDTSGL